MSAERVITIEYLAPCMSKELLCKFPDESKFGFDYSQSQIWSPLLLRGRNFSSIEHRSVKEKLLLKKNKKKKAAHRSISKKLEFSPNPTPIKGWQGLLRAATKRFKTRHLSALQRILPALLA